MRQAFEQCKRDAHLGFWTAFRHLQIKRIRRLFANPNEMVVDKFNREFWAWGDPIEFQGVRTRFYSLDLGTVPSQWPSALLHAIETGVIELHGNYMFNQPTNVFETTNPDAADKTRRIQEALRILNDDSRTPEDKAHDIIAIAGFGASNATALVSIFHPDTYAVCNGRSRMAVNKLLETDLKLDHPPSAHVDRFQELAQYLKEQLGAHDLIELDGFFNEISYDQWSTGDFDVQFTPLTDAQLDNTALDDPAFPEGRIALRTHLAHERNKALIQKAKARFKAEHGRLFCQACEFDFSQAYGPLGEGYIEAHHSVPVSQLQEGDVTRFSDLAMVCSNCHRMLHRRRPWLRLDQLRQLLVTPVRTG